MPDPFTVVLLLGSLAIFVGVQGAYSRWLVARRAARSAMPVASSAALACMCGRCEPGDTFRCDGCGREAPLCAFRGGEADDLPDHCDECWYAVRCNDEVSHA